MHNYFCLGLAILLFPILSLANSLEKLSPQDICKSIDSMKYQSQCESAMYKGRFDQKALRVCILQKNDYDKKSCLEVIKNKYYQAMELEDCQKDPKARVHMCLKKSGKLFESNPAQDQYPDEAPIEN